MEHDNFIEIRLGEETRVDEHFTSNVVEELAISIVLDQNMLNGSTVISQLFPKKKDERILYELKGAFSRFIRRRGGSGDAMALCPLPLHFLTSKYLESRTDLSMEVIKSGFLNSFLYDASCADSIGFSKKQAIEILISQDYYGKQISRASLITKVSLLEEGKIYVFLMSWRPPKSEHLPLFLNAFSAKKYSKSKITVEPIEKLVAISKILEYCQVYLLRLRKND